MLTYHRFTEAGLPANRQIADADERVHNESDLEPPKSNSLFDADELSHQTLPDTTLHGKADMDDLMHEPAIYADDEERRNQQ